jgi:DNA (cytosine-5)-methyltransferase 1
MRAISLFTGAGGLDLGCEAAGFMSVAAAESKPRARETLLMNGKWFPRLHPQAVHQDVLDLDAEDLMQRAGVARRELDLVHGGPPCTPFSKSGYWLAYKRALDDSPPRLEVGYPGGRDAPLFKSSAPTTPRPENAPGASR